MAPIPQISGTAEEYQTIVEYLRSGTFSDSILRSLVVPTTCSNFARHCKNFEVDENGILYAKPVVKNSVVKFEKCYVVPKYDVGMRAIILKHFYDQANHCEYHKTFFAILERQIGITQEEVKIYVNECATCTINTSIKEKTNVISVVSLGLWQHIQIDLVDFRKFAEANNGFLWLLTCVCVSENAITEFFITTQTTTNAATIDATTTDAAVITTDATTTDATTTDAIVFETATQSAESKAVEECLSQMLKLQESVNKSLEKYRARIYQQGSVHRKKTVNNTIEAGATIAIAPDHNMNQQTRKKKLQPTFS
ncbi:10314_t:CDS:2 [Cetraspora pellucida]|uniref:10314_t:CDS:1 n=1 Tax=Cetraspora pellucida TaxID=1433469 RepID=A0ACA9KJ70_9GLOM|nr:10314_t:CDS:2 [Cetraspora pellucida]